MRSPGLVPLTGRSDDGMRVDKRKSLMTLVMGPGIVLNSISRQDQLRPVTTSWKRFRLDDTEDEPSTFTWYRVRKRKVRALEESNKLVQFLALAL
ncbi:hypothetical protein BJY00DRAFT_95331 [Aspergillus carlsbadensis]|nr:hypothetical protein BJY00DRAFT_95331 [Aspergillus carlsbadensis]